MIRLHELITDDSITGPGQALEKGMRQEQQEREKAVQPLRERLSVIEGLVSQKEEQLKRLLELYLDGQFERRVLGEKQAQIRSTIAQLKGTKESLETQVTDQTISDQQIETVEEFAEQVGAGLTGAESDEPRSLLRGFFLRKKPGVES
jgi:transposase